MDYGDPYSDSPSPPRSLRPKRRQPSFSLSACFGGGSSACFGAGSSACVGERPLAPLLGSSKGFRSKARERPELGGKCLDLISSHAGGRHYRPYHALDFSYDPLSYALNFDDGSNSDSHSTAEDHRNRFFSSRLPASCPRTVGVPFDKAREGNGM